MEPRNRFSAIAILTTLLLLAATAIAVAEDDESSPSYSHPELSGPPQPGDYLFHHQDNHDWYKDLKQPSNGAGCCTNDNGDHDCRITYAEQDENGNWWAIVDRQKVFIPPHVVLPFTAPDGHAHVCASPITGTIFCFVRPGDMI